MQGREILQKMISCTVIALTMDRNGGTALPEAKAETPLRQLLEPYGDLQTRRFPDGRGAWVLLFFTDLMDDRVLQEQVITPLQQRLNENCSIDEMVLHIPVRQTFKPRKAEDVVQHLIEGWTYIGREGEPGGWLLHTRKAIYRDPSQSEVESQIMGPQVAFGESLQINRALVRQFLPDPALRIRGFQIGSSTKTRVELFYMENKASASDLALLVGKLGDIRTDGLTDTSMLGTYLDDNPNSLFPQMISSERPDRVVNNLLAGKLIIMMEGSPFALITPSRFFDFFESAEDRYLRRNMAAFLRLLRLVAIFISVFFTPMYVAALTFHYQLIPSNMLVPLAQSRSKVPFPPLMEALLLEFIIELLREAGARLPTKVGQTMGIVGGIVIGQAAVQAGFTSNILIIIVALAALASFITPVYMMGAAIRILRFPMLLLAGTMGMVGITIGISFVTLHLLRLSTIGHSYIYPFYPWNMSKGKHASQRRPRSDLRSGDDIYEQPAGDGS